MTSSWSVLDVQLYECPNADIKVTDKKKSVVSVY